MVNLMAVFCGRLGKQPSKCSLLQCRPLWHTHFHGSKRLTSVVQSLPNGVEPQEELASLRWEVQEKERTGSSPTRGPDEPQLALKDDT